MGQKTILEDIMILTSGQIVAFVIGLLGAILTVLNIIDKVVTLKAREEEPFKILQKKVDEHDCKIKELELAQDHNSDNFKAQDDTNEVLIRSVFALLEFEVHYCETEQKPISKNLEKAKDDLHDYLAKK